MNRDLTRNPNVTSANTWFRQPLQLDRIAPKFPLLRFAPDEPSEVR